MKKVLIVVFACFTTMLFADIISDLQGIDKEIQKQNYDAALSKSREALKKAISDDDKKALESVIIDIENKIKNTGKIITNIGVDNVDVVENQDLNATDTGTLPGLPSEQISDGSKFAQYKNYEKQIVATGNSEAIHGLAMLYIKENLYESAMNLALKDKSRNIKNVYLAATAARMIGKFDRSIKLYDDVLSKNPDHAKTYLGLAMAYKGKGNFEKALKYLRIYSKYNNSERIQQDLGVLGSK